ncbi:MAG: hypothetical protein J5I47_06710 [Vicingus serpentipes]|nr:hypothetical protein [Vicingus serpentipes]
MKAIDITGEKFGRLTAIKYIESKNKKRFYLCKCDCGNEVKITVDNLRSGNSSSCGCLAKELLLKRNKENRLPDNGSVWNLFYKRHIRNSTDRNLENYLSLEEWKNIVSENCHYCGDSPIEKTHQNLHGSIYINGLDRINNDLGYTTDNVVPCCEWCNKMKLDKNQSDFLNKIEKIWNKKKYS